MMQIFKRTCFGKTTLGCVLVVSNVLLQSSLLAETEFVDSFDRSDTKFNKSLGFGWTSGSVTTPPYFARWNIEDGKAQAADIEATAFATELTVGTEYSISVDIEYIPVPSGSGIFGLFGNCDVNASPSLEAVFLTDDKDQNIGRLILRQNGRSDLLLFEAIEGGFVANEFYTLTLQREGNQVRVLLKGQNIEIDSDWRNLDSSLGNVPSEFYAGMLDKQLFFKNFNLKIFLGNEQGSH